MSKINKHTHTHTHTNDDDVPWGFILFFLNID